MTRRLREAIERLQALPDNQQDRMAEFLLHELAEDERWARTTRENAAKLDQLSDQVLAVDAAGRCEPLDPDRL
jgi:hypothetical protein